MKQQEQVEEKCSIYKDDAHRANFMECLSAVAICLGFTFISQTMLSALDEKAMEGNVKDNFDEIEEKRVTIDFIEEQMELYFKSKTALATLADRFGLDDLDVVLGVLSGILDDPLFTDQIDKTLEKTLREIVDFFVLLEREEVES